VKVIYLLQNSIVPELKTMNVQKFTADDAACPMNYPGFVFSELLKQGFKAETLLHGAALTEERFQDPNCRVEFATLRQFILKAIEATGDPHLGPRLALRFEAHYIGQPAYAAMNAPRFVDGLRNLIRFAYLTFPALEFAFQSKLAFQSRETLRPVAGYGFI